jgi:hypothetical protein
MTTFLDLWPWEWKRAKDGIDPVGGGVTVLIPLTTIKRLTAVVQDTPDINHT